MTPEAKQHLNQLANQLHLFGVRVDCCTSLHWYRYEHKGKWYCYPHWAAVKHVND